MEYSLQWLPGKDGTYSTKSGYALLQIQSSISAHSSLSWKRSVWNLQCSPKLNLFLWKAASGALPVGSALSRRGMMSNTTCRRCGELETEIHVLFHCPFAVKVWDLIPAMHKPFSSINSVHQLLHSCLKIVNLPHAGVSSPLFPWILWNLWTGRNQLLFKDKKFTEQEVVSKAIRDARAWDNAQLPRQTHTTTPQSAIFQCLRPSSGNPLALICFSDAAWQESSGNGGVGWIFQNRSGDIVAHGSSARRFVSSALVAEALAIKTALLNAANSGYRDLEVFSDCKSLISMINSNESSVALKGLLYDIAMLSRAFSSISFSFIPRLNNVAADNLAKTALSSLCIVSNVE
ncbi:hypothetical protein Bca4012_019913 [Brassica carinata]